MSIGRISFKAAGGITVGMGAGNSDLRKIATGGAGTTFDLKTALVVGVVDPGSVELRAWDSCDAGS